MDMDSTLPEIPQPALPDRLWSHLVEPDVEAFLVLKICMAIKPLLPPDTHNAGKALFTILHLSHSQIPTLPRPIRLRTVAACKDFLLQRPELVPFLAQVCKKNALLWFCENSKSQSSPFQSCA
jgi:hypothetical protein